MVLDVVVNFFHSLATAAWIGGMLFMKLVLMPVQEAIEPSQRPRLMIAIAPRFTITAWASVIVLVIIGFLKTPAGRLMDFGSRFGTALAIKHLLIVPVIVISLVITFAFVPKLRLLAPAPGQLPSEGFVRAQERLEMLSAINSMLGMLILLAVAVMSS